MTEKAYYYKGSWYPRCCTSFQVFICGLEYSILASQYEEICPTLTPSLFACLEGIEYEKIYCSGYTLSRPGGDIIRQWKMAKKKQVQIKKDSLIGFDTNSEFAEAEEE